MNEKNQAPAAESAPEFIMPDAPIGATVLYKKGLGAAQKCYPATVRERKNRTLNLVVQGSNAGKNGVRHEEDPWCKQHADKVGEYGCWVQSPQETRTSDLEKVVLELAKDVAELKAAAAAKRDSVTVTTYNPKKG